MRIVLVVICLALTLSTFVWLAGREVEAPAKQVDTEPITMPLIVTAFKPFEYHVNACGNCHGSYAQQHNKVSLRNMSDDRLTQVVREMTEGQGQSPLDTDEQLAVLVKYHQLFRDDLPIVVQNQNDTSGASGEISPGSTLELVRADGQKVLAIVTGHRWSAAAGEYVKWVATLNDKRVVFEAGK